MLQSAEDALALLHDPNAYVSIYVGHKHYSTSTIFLPQQAWEAGERDLLRCLLQDAHKNYVEKLKQQIEVAKQALEATHV